MNRWILLFFVFTLPNTANAQENAEFELAKHHYANQEYDNALQIWNSCVEKDSTSNYCKEQAGLSAYRLGMFPQSKEYLLKIGNDPQYFKSAYVTLANIYEQQENIPKAIKYNTMLKDSFPDNPIYYRKLGALYLKAKLLTEAFPKYAKALALNPNDLISIKALSEIFIANEQFQEADSLLNIGLALDDESIGLTLLLAKNYYVQKEYDSTVVVLETLKGRHDFTNYHNKMMGYALLQIDSTDNAIWYLERSLVDESNPEYAHYYLANAYEIKEEYETSEFHYNKAIDAGASQGLHTYHRNLARIQKENSNFKDAIENYKWALKYRDDPTLILFLAQACDNYYRDKSIAINYYNKYLKSNDDNAKYKKYARDRISYLRENRHLEVGK